MEHLYRIPKKIIVLGLLLFFFSCSQDETVNSNLQTNETQSFSAKMSNEKLNVFKGPEVALGYGKVRSWVSVNKEGFPSEIGIEITPEAFKNLSDENAKSVPPEGATIVVPLHEKAMQSTPFDHIGLNWNPHGHEPVGFFDVPHFDIHFYMISVEEQMAIPAWSPATNDAFNNYPPPGYLPADYGTPPGPATAEAEMGKHWAPNNLPTLLPFTKVLIYGTFDGEFIFIEPMITLNYFLSKEDFSIPYSQPDFFAKSGNYPTKYNVFHNSTNGNTYVTLSDFVWRTKK
ncbi:hypothetical protein [Flavobacterium gilvum]|uniref:DUF5602 domain-containing protein n=1 Tax=Flavobacterium gilvum TaxID=1492737 RepID=A0AAC9I615_9FLAO|nr:hypothetical protein [Flavobacterium gilvum]AOW11116.1 hypothetical protein EM308_17410 [Flavobacterium gilvum]KFC61045.1 hypothetical protein FEM08_01670 [Flavobacterium gilvum]